MRSAPNYQVLRVERLCFRALTERAISESKAAELLGIPVRELTCRMDQLGAH